MNITAVLPYTLEGWLEKQNSVTVGIYEGYGKEMGVIRPPNEVIENDPFARELYLKMHDCCQHKYDIIVGRKRLYPLLRYPYGEESTDYESEHNNEQDDFEEKSESILRSYHLQ